MKENPFRTTITIDQQKEAHFLTISPGFAFDLINKYFYACGYRQGTFKLDYKNEKPFLVANIGDGDPEVNNGKGTDIFVFFPLKEIEFQKVKEYL